MIFPLTVDHPLSSKDSVCGNVRSCGTFQCHERRVQGNVVCVTEVGDVEAAEEVVRNLADATQEEFLRRAGNVMHASLGKFNVRQGGFGGGGKRDASGRHRGRGDGEAGEQDGSDRDNNVSSQVGSDTEALN